jgi:subtilisin family serine protease
MAPRKSAEEVNIPPKLYANVSPHSIGGVSMFAAGAQINSDTVTNFFSEEKVVASAVEKLKLAGFEILQVSDISINIAAPIDVYEKAFNCKIGHEERPVIKPGAVEDTATFWEAAKAETPGLITTKGTAFADVLEGVAIEVPRYWMQPSALPPSVGYWHLDVPADVALGDNAQMAHASGITGSGQTVAMCDSGWYKHPFFVSRGYRVAPVVLGPGAANPLDDEVGHGTGESANIFAVAPDVQLLPVKISFVNTLAGFNTAVGLHPTIITCSWGSSVPVGPLSAADQALAAAISAAVASGIVVVFSAGNGHWGFPGQHPDVISAGGVFMDNTGALQASNYASGFMSNIYPNRRVPDLSGLVGMLPKAIYIMLPLESGDQIDVGNAGGAFPNGDETPANDGWAAFSGTSAAAPQLAGAAALVKQACPRLTPAEVRDVLMASARDVVAGNCSAATGGAAAGPGPDVATGNGLLDAHKAVLLAKIRCLGPIRGVRAPGVREIEPVRGIRDVTPRGIVPRKPEPGPIEPRPEPIRTPIQPEPIQPTGPAAAAPQAAPAEPAAQPVPLTAEDIAALEAMVLQSGTGIV